MRNFKFAAFVLVVLMSEDLLAQQMVNVAIASGSLLEVTGTVIKLYDDGEKAIMTADHFKIAIKGKRVSINGKLMDSPLRLLSDQAMTVGTKKVRGELDILVEQGDMTVVHPIFLENYVAGIVASEMPKSWPMEALKAQAIASRTYALFQKYRRIDKPYHLDSTVLDQVYGGLDHDHERAEQAAKETEGLVLTFEAKLVQAFFHSSCGGEMASALEGWGFSVPYLPGGACGYCTKSGSGEWRYKVSKKAFEKAIADYKLKGLTDVKLGSVSDSGRVKNVELSFKKNKMQISVADLRKRLGYSNLKSTLLDRVEVGHSDLTFYGRGFGHGVGMCQWGANGMAKEGFIASHILARYYPGSELRRIY
jgi:stage II sporulation protein D